MHEITQLLVLVWRVMFSQTSIFFFPFPLQVEQVLRTGNKSEELEEQLLISKRQTSQEKEQGVSQQLLPCNDSKPVVRLRPCLYGD